MQNNFAMNLKKLRIHLCIKHADLARLIDISEPTLWGYTDKGKQPKLSTLIKLANIFKVDLDTLVFKEISIEDLYRIKEKYLQLAKVD